jgi:CheY-like chemotaxis protein
MGKSASILVVDGSRDCADAVAMMFRSSGLDAVAIYDGVDALSQVAQSHPAAVVTDFEVPGLSGFEIAGRVRASEGRTLRLVAYTGWVVPDLTQRAKVAGFDEVISKTADPMELLRAVSPDTYELMLRSMTAGAEQVRLQVRLSHAMLDHAAVSSNSYKKRRLHQLVEVRLKRLGRSLLTMPLVAEERDELRQDLTSLFERLNRRS